MRRLLLGLLSILPFGIGTPALAATISGSYYEDFVEVGCQNSRSCLAKFPLPAASAGKILTLHTISCGGTADSTLVQGSFYLTDDPGGNLRRAQFLSLNGVHGDGLFSFREAVETKVAGGPPRVFNVSLSFLDVLSSINLKCSIVGQLGSQ